jgi:hypothetical protein
LGPLLLQGLLHLLDLDLLEWLGLLDLDLLE